MPQFTVNPSRFDPYKSFDLRSNGSSVAIQSIKLEIEGWERDAEVVEPEERAF
ncbi:MAG: hypothetical protein ABR593_00215 [Candidatus Limnocylindria bacterium]